MAGTGKKTAAHTGAADTSAAVSAFMLALEHPFKVEIEAIRQSMLSVATSIAEGVKWNAPSFRTGEYFATLNLREKKGVGIILHLGAKVKALPADGIAIADPAGLLKWLAQDRAMIVFADLDDFKARQAAFEPLIRSWIAYV
jgi:hypothetical protein